MQIYADSIDTLPRQKLIEKGPSVLSNSELLAIIFITGTKDENVIELSKRVMQEYGARSLTNFTKVKDIKDYWGLGEVKACQLMALFELGRRIFEPNNRIPKYIVGPEDIYKLVKNQAQLKQEQLSVLYVNQKQQLIRDEIVALGNENMNIVKTKDIIRPALEYCATGIIMVHNHPSGNPFPSDNDMMFTDEVKKACDILGIELLDHIILGHKDYFSMQEEKYI